MLPLFKTMASLGNDDLPTRDKVIKYLCESAAFVLLLMGGDNLNAGRTSWLQLSPLPASVFFAWFGFEWPAIKRRLTSSAPSPGEQLPLAYMGITSGGAFTQSLSESIAVEIKNGDVLTSKNTHARVRLESDHGIFIAADPAHWRVQKRTERGDFWTGVRFETDIPYGDSQLLMIAFRRKNGPWQIFGGSGEDTFCGTLVPDNWKAKIIISPDSAKPLVKEIHFSITEDIR